MLKSLMNLILLMLFYSIVVYSQSQDYGNANPNNEIVHFPSVSSNTIGSWSSLPNSPNPFSRSCCALVRINGTDFLYQFGGGDYSSQLRRVARLNLSNNTWANSVSTMPYQISSGTAVPMRGDSVIYVFGGNDNTLGKTLRYNLYSNSWQTMADMPIKVTDAFVVKYSESMIYIIGGGDGYFGTNNFRTNRVQVYNTKTNTYTLLAGNYPINCAMLGGGIYRDTIIAVGGYTNGGSATANCYKGVINPMTLNVNWSPMPSYPGGPIVRFASFVAVKGDGVGIMCTGGAVNGAAPTSETYLWNFCTQTWQNNLPDNSLARSNFKAAGRGNEIYIVAGFTNTGVGTTEKITFQHIDGPCSNMVGVNSSGNSIPENYYLDQNYPNPFNPSTKISFGIPKSSKVNLIVFDQSGKEVMELTNREFAAGQHSIEFNGENLSSGVYFYALTSGDFSTVRKMVLIK